MKKDTLDYVQEKFRDKPTSQNAIEYLRVAMNYHNDEMIADTTLIHEVIRDIVIKLELLKS